MDTIELKPPGLSLWRHISEIIGGEIRSGKIKPGAAIPSEYELVARFDVSRHTVRRAIMRLREQGLVDVVQGRGAFVRMKALEYTITERTRFAKHLKQKGVELRNRFLAAKKIAASVEIARLLRLDRREPVWRITVISYADEVPVSLGCVFHPARRFPNIVQDRETNPDIASVYAHYGVEDYTRLSTWIATRMPTEAEAELLQIDVLDPVIVSQKIDVDPKGVPIEYNETLFSGRSIRLHFPTSDLAMKSGLPDRPPTISRSVLDSP